MHRHNPTSLCSCHPQVPQHEGNQQFHQNTSLEDMVKQLIDNEQKIYRILGEIRQIDFRIPGLKDLETKLDQYNVEDYWRETSKECKVFQIEPYIVIARNEGENEMKIDVISDKPKKPQIESVENQPLVLVQPPTLPSTFGTPYKGVKLRERSHIFYTADTFVLDDPDAIDSFVLEVPNELLNLKEGVHASLPKYVDAPFVVDISKGEGIT
ncbi:hypothetical protein Scep_027502 [Stephania cephalantha]|uniref:Uncharacterized protein n=1 Tax=Stephania cephalantha TaxID=152367 RepID=A0AAP0E821_9MAGN